MSQVTDGLSSVLPGMNVYVQHKTDVWIRAFVTDINKYTCKVCLFKNKEAYECSVGDILPCSEQSLLEINSLTELSPINQASVLCCLHERYNEGIYYTSAGSTILAVNPFCDVAQLYSVDVAFAYHLDEKDEPHIYRIGCDAYRRMCRGLGQTNQCIIVSGESGSGKTVSAKHLLRYMTLVSNCSSDERPERISVVCQSVERRILDSNPILEAFGNAITQRNDNSSRFGKFVQLQFSRSGQMLGAEIHTYLLEKTRVVHQSQTESNFHIFYQVMSSLLEAKDTVLGKLVGDIGADGFKILPKGKCIENNRDLTETLDAMTEIGLTQESQNDIVKILVAILFLCNVEFTPIEEELSKLLQDKDDQYLDTTCFELEVTPVCIQQTADLLGLEASHIEQVMLYRSIHSGGNKRRSIFVKPVPQTEAYSRRDCLATLLYSQMFEWLVKFINEQIKTDECSRTIGLLDIYGFEAFKTNSLEQLCINYANEKLQQHYVQHFLKDLQREYEAECINWQFLSYTDNQPCLDLLEGQPSVFGLLNEDVQLNRKTDAQQLCERILLLGRSHKQYINKPKSFMKTPAFTIHHYAGDVTYTGEGLSMKNKDNIPQELIVMLQNSSNVFVSRLFEGYQCDETTGRRKKTVLGKFKASLDILMTSLQRSDVHYIRCIKPNTAGSSTEFDRQFVMSQMVANGIIETVKVSCHGYPVRMGYATFLQRYGLILRNAPSPPPSDTESSTVHDCDTLYDPLDAIYKRQLDMISADSPRRSNTPRKRLRRRAGLSSADHTRRCSAAVLKLQFGHCQGLTQQFGKTKLFLHQHQVDKLETTRLEILDGKASQIQRAWRRYRCRCDRRQKKILEEAAKIIQASWGKYKKHKRAKAVLLLQKSFRMHSARVKFRKMLLKLKQEKEKKKSWKPIMDRKRTSPGTRRSRPSSRTSQRSDTSDGSLCKSDCSSLSEKSEMLENAENLLQKDDKTLMKQFITSTPDEKHKRKHHLNTSILTKTKSTENETEHESSVIKKSNKMIKGRPNFSVLNSKKYTKDDKSTSTAVRGKKPFTALDNRTVNCHGDTGAPPIKKQRTNNGCVTTLAEVAVGDGIVTRRRLPKVPIRFHTRPSVLKNAHIIHQRELKCGLQDCLPGNDST